MTNRFKARALSALGCAIGTSGMAWSYWSCAPGWRGFFQLFNAFLLGSTFTMAAITWARTQERA